MRNAPEVVREVGVHDLRMAVKQRRFHHDHRLLGISPWTVAHCSGGRSASKIGSSTSIAAVMQTPIPQGRNAQRSSQFSFGILMGSGSESLLPERKRQFAKSSMHPYPLRTLRRNNAM